MSETAFLGFSTGVSFSDVKADVPEGFFLLGS
jgi:hypothetical protein